MPYTPPAYSNVTIPTMDASGDLVVSFSRNPKKFSVNRYAHLRKVKKRLGYYLTIDPADAARVNSLDGSESLWPLNQPRPAAKFVQNHQFHRFDCERHTRGFELDRETVKHAEWDIKRTNGAAVAQQLMTERTLRALSALNGASWGTNTAAVDGTLLTGGQNWTNGTPTAPNIFNSLLQAKEAIEKATVGALSSDDMILVVDPTTARKMATSPEIHSYLKESPFAEAKLRDKNNWNQQFGLPPDLYGFTVVVEKAVVEAAKKGGATDRKWALNGSVGTATAYLLTRPEDEGMALDEGGDDDPTVHSTIAVLSYEEMNVEVFEDSKNRMLDSYITEDNAILVTSVLSGFKFTAIV